MRVGLVTLIGTLVLLVVFLTLTIYILAKDLNTDFVNMRRDLEGLINNKVTGLDNNASKEIARLAGCVRDLNTETSDLRKKFEAHKHNGIFGRGGVR